MVPGGVRGGAAAAGAGCLREPGDRWLRRARARVQGLDPPYAGDRALRDGTRVGADRRQHLPRRALGRTAVPSAARARIRGLPDADPGAVPVLERHPRRRGRERDPRVQLRPGDREGQESRTSTQRAATVVTDPQPRVNDGFTFYFASWYK